LPGISTALPVAFNFCDLEVVGRWQRVRCVSLRERKKRSFRL
jgi:hypothetical protein